MDKTSWGGFIHKALIGNNEEIKNTSVTWLAEASANTEKDVDIVLPNTIDGDNLYEILIHNPSTVTALSVDIKVKWTDSGDTTRYSTLTNLGINSAEGEANLVQGSLLAEGSRITLSNDTVLGVGEGFTAYIQVREV